MNVEIESADVVRLILQFLKENNLTQSMQALQAEANLAMNTVDDLETFAADIQHGRWDAVLPQVSMLQLPLGKMVDLYEQIVIEMVELREFELARDILRTAAPMIRLKEEDPERYLRLEHHAQRGFGEMYKVGSNKETRRREIAEAIVAEVSVVEPSRLLTLLGHALRWQQSQGLLPRGEPYDLFKGAARAQRRDQEERYPRRQAGMLRFPEESHPETCTFSPDGQYFVTGTVDGFVEVWDYENCQLRKDLEYQAKDEIMLHKDQPVLCSAFSRDGEYLATGDNDGQVKIWRISTGQCVRRFPKAHIQGITSVTFSRDGTQIVTTSFDGTAKLHGLKSGKQLKVFSGHTSFVNCAVITADNSRILTGSSDGTVRIWDVRTTECLLTFRPGLQAGAPTETAIHTLQLMPNNPEHVMIGTKSAFAFIMTTQGQLVKSFSSGKQTKGNLVCATVSPQGHWLYCGGEDGTLYAFNVESGQLDHVLQASDREIISIAHHPHRNLVATVNDAGMLKLWKP